MEDDQESIIEFSLEDMVDTWIEGKFNAIRQELHHILAQIGAVLVVEDDVELIDYEELDSFLKGEQS